MINYFRENNQQDINKLIELEREKWNIIEEVEE